MWRKPAGYVTANENDKKKISLYPEYLSAGEKQTTLFIKTSKAQIISGK